MTRRECWNTGLLCVLGLLLSACAVQPAAPIVNRSLGSDRSTPVSRPRVHEVAANETLAGIALRFGLSYQQLAAWNHLANPDHITTGQVLRLTPPERPLPAPVSPGARPIATPMPAKEPEAALTRGIALPQPVEREALQPAPPPLPPRVGTRPVPAAPPPLPSVAKPPAPHGLPWVWPADGRILEGFDNRRHGIDIGGHLGDPVRAAAAGTVVYSGSGLRGYGKLIIIRHDRNYITAYAHNARLLVREGARVKAGQVVARMGQTGNAGRVLLHFEIRKRGKPIDPLEKLPPRA